jgi:hypothetical protein
MRSDNEIQQDVQQEFEWEPSLQHEDIAVAVRGGVVTLAGFAKSYADKLTAERLAGQIKGVKAIANEIEIRLLSSWVRPDPEIARAALDALKWHTSVPDERIKVTIAQGWAQTPCTATLAIRQDARGPYLGPATRRSVPGTADSGPANWCAEEGGDPACNLLR